jgi:hypothetical protein
MKADLLTTARDQAERSTPAVRAAALIRIARVETAVAPGDARATFERGLEAARQIASPDREMLLDQARYIAAAVAPDLLPQIRPLRTRTMGAMDGNLYRIMIQHGHVSEAMSFLLEQTADAEFPFYAAPMVLQHVADKDKQLALVRHAVSAWRTAPTGRQMFPHTFQSLWKILPGDEAREVVRELVRSTLSEPDTHVNAAYDREGTVQITSSRQSTLFGILGPLRHLDPSLAESLIAEHEQLAAAARRFPNGMESVVEEARQRAAAEPGGRGGGYFMAGNPRDFPYMHSLMQAGKDGEFGPPMQFALERYGEDTAADNPNAAPIDCWPSTGEFRSILFRAGQKLGADAARLLDEIPDADLRLFAQIELAAALEGLPEAMSIRMFRPKRPPRV